MPTKSISRRELNDLVWSKPMREVAAGFGISDVGLKKICARYDVPTPPQGYWLRKGKEAPRQTPVLARGRPEQIIDIQTGTPPPDLLAEEAVQQTALMAYEAAPENRIEVQAGGDLHPIARRVQEVLLASKPDDYGSLRCLDPALPYVRVSPSGAPRATGIVDTLCRAFKQRRWVVEPGRECLAVVVEGTRTPILIEETSSRRLHMLTQEEKEQKRRHPWRTFPMYDFVPSGNFAIKASTYRTLVRDTTRLRVEDRLNELTCILIRSAFEGKASAREAQAEGAIRAERQRRHEEITQLREVRQKAVERLERQAGAFERANRIRAFIAAAGPEAQRGETWKEWAAWASAYADSLDPLKGMPSVFTLPLDELERLRILEDGSE